VEQAASEQAVKITANVRFIELELLAGVGLMTKSFMLSSTCADRLHSRSVATDKRGSDSHKTDANALNGMKPVMSGTPVHDA
jgi:hypothetical protein